MADKISTFTTDEFRFLSNFYPHKKVGMYEHILEIEYEGIVFDCVECAYHAAKVLDVEMRLKIADMSPYEVVDLFKSGTIEVRKDWDNIKVDIMRELVWKKFNGHYALGKMLLDTGDAELIEGNDWDDVFWGVCNGVDENHLGKILMDVRERLKSHSSL